MLPSSSAQLQPACPNIPPPVSYHHRGPRRRRQRQRQQSLRCASSYSSSLLLLVLLSALVVPAPAGAIGWPFRWKGGWGNSSSEGQQAQQAQQCVAAMAAVAAVEANKACEAALLSSAAAEGKEPAGGVDTTGAEGRVVEGGSGGVQMATFHARRKQSAEVEVRGTANGGKGAERRWQEYLQSESAKAPILNAQKWTRLGSDLYRCEMAPISFFSAQIVPVIDVKLEIDPTKRTARIHARSGKVRKSEDAPSPSSEQQATADGYACTDCGQWNETSFTMKTQNLVTWAHVDDSRIRLTSELLMEVSFEKPAWIWVPSSMMNRVGSLVLKRVVKKALPEFLDRIISGYRDWAAAADASLPSAAAAGRGRGAATTTVV